MKIIVTTSDQYHHCLPVFFDCYNRHWGDQFELVGYKRPIVPLPDNCSFISLGKQRGPEYFGEDLREYFNTQSQWMVWMMEDSFIRSFNRGRYETAKSLCTPETGRVNLTKEGMNRPHAVVNGAYYCLPGTQYRLSTMPSIWNREFLLKYLTPGLTPWKFELQTTDDNFLIAGLVDGVIEHNEGVRKQDIYKLNLEGLYA